MLSCELLGVLSLDSGSELECLVQLFFAPLHYSLLAK